MNNFGTDLKNQLLCKGTIDETSSFDVGVLAVNAACGIGGYFLGNKVIAPKTPKMAGFLRGDAK